MLGMVFFAMLATSSPTDPGIGNPGLDSRAPAQSVQTREQVSDLAELGAAAVPSVALPSPGAAGR